MDKPLVIVGTGLLAEQVAFYLGGVAGRPLAAFVLDPQYIREPTFLQRPVLDFVEAQARFPASTHDLFVAIGHTATAARRRWFDTAMAAGYSLPSYVHPTAWVAQNVAVGANTLIQEQAVVAPFVRLGDNVTLCPQVGINHHTRVGSHCFFAPGARVAGDADIGPGCFIGLGALVRDRVRVGEGCVIGAGAVIMADCPAGGLYRATRTDRTREVES
ncbi:acetyltransferase [Azohydromonas aeria]|uniref:acetyltransferase n=1 Tax=Azohydromonas aeria TaxID=2590212 RepID=UPI0012F9C5FC|nr:acetyltransferase [Azohydromonas aeria]